MEIFNDFFNRFPSEMTDRLVLKEITCDDIDTILAIFSDKEVVKYYDCYAFTSNDDAIMFINVYSKRYEQKTGIRWGLYTKEDMCLIGTCGFNTINHKNYEGTIGFELRRLFWGRGLMSEALKKIISIGFEQLGLNRISGNVMIGNIKSRNTLSKLGFQYEGTLREVAFFKDNFHDLQVFSLLKKDWK